MNGKKRTIVILSAKRCGSTALYKTLVKHRDVRNCQVGGKERNWEPAFWYHGWLSIMRMQSEHMKEYYAKNYSYMSIPDVNNKQDLFNIWDKVLKHRGPIVVDKSPQYLSCKQALDLLLAYKMSGRDVKIIGLIRDPKDAITSQYLLWKGVHAKKTGIIDTPERREEKWLEKYNNLKYVKRYAPDTLMVKYEDFVTNTHYMVQRICRYCGINYQGGMANHVVPTNIGRYRESQNKRIRGWQKNFSKEFKKHLTNYGYEL